MASKTADRNFLQGQSVELFRAAIKSQATRDAYEIRLQVRTDSVIRRAISIAFLVSYLCAMLQQPLPDKGIIFYSNVSSIRSHMTF